MSGRPWLSVIIPTLNEAACIEATLAPLQPWRDQGVEVLLSDGGSADDTVARARPLVDQVLVVEAGRARQMNAGARAARGSLLWFLHADTQCTDAALKALQAWPNEAQWGRFDVTLSGRHYLFPVIAWLMNWRSALTGICTGDQGLVVRAEVFEGVGGFPDQPLMEDVALSRRLRALQWPRRLRCRLETDSRRWQQSGVWRTILLMWSLRWRYFRGADPAVLLRRYR